MVTESQINRRRAGFPLSTNDLTMLLVVFIWGMNFPITKGALAEFPPMAFIGVRFTLGAILLWGIMRMREGAALPTGSWLRLIGLGLVGITINQICFVLGLRLSTISNSALLLATAPAMVAFAGAFLGIEQVTRRMVLGIVLAFGGVAVVVMAGGHIGGGSLIGDLLLLGAAASWAAYTLGVRTLIHTLTPLQITAWSTVAGVPGLILVAIPEWTTMNWGSIGMWSWAGLSYSAVLSLGVGYMLWNTSIRVAGSNRTVIFNSAIPLVATLAAWPMFGEVPTIWHAIGALLIISGVLATRLGKRAS